MSVFAPPMASDWQPHRLGSRSNGLASGADELGLGLGFGRIQTSTLERPSLKSHKSFPNSLTSSYNTSNSPDLLGQVNNPAGQEEDLSSVPIKQEQSGQPAVETTYGGSAPASPAAVISPTSAEAEHEDRQEDEDNLLGAADEEDDGAEKSESKSMEKTAEQRRAEKRKMKRFRLTHNQTRFLMSEFARQAHPDAAQRERLAKEIPGLSPRQVQVWFQNRRAKLKRLTTDDRERMMKSRALPEDFDMTQALHSPFTAGIHQPFPQGYTTPLQSPPSYSSNFSEHGMIRPPLMVAGVRRGSEDENAISPISMSSNFSSFYTPPGSITTTESLSPTSPVAERTPFVSNWQQAPGGRGSDTYSRSSSISSTFHPQIPRLHLAHDRLARTRAESLGSPLRSSMSYTGDLDFNSSNTEETVPASNNNGLQHPRSFPTDAASLSKTTGFSYLPQGFQSSALARPRSNFPPGLDLRPSYRRSLFPFSKLAQQAESQTPNSQTQDPNNIGHQTHNLANAQPGTPQHPQAPQSPHHSLAYSSAPLVPPQDFHLPNAQDLYGGVSYQNPENGIHTYGVGVNTAHQTASMGEQSLEPESYYKSEPGTQRITLSQHSAQHDQHAPQQYHQNVHNQSNQLLQPPQPQQYSPLSSTPHSAGLKRPHEDEGEEYVERGQTGSEIANTSRRRSFTLPTGFPAGQSH